MTSLYGRLQQVSAKLIRQFGSHCEILRAQTGQYNPATGEVESTVTPQTAYCLFDTLAYDFSRNQNNANVEVGDVVLYLTEKADINDIVVANGEQWQIVKVQPIKPANTVIYYQAQGRKYGTVHN